VCGPKRRYTGNLPLPQNEERGTSLAMLVLVGFFCFFTFIDPHGASHGELNQPSPQFQADRPQSVKVYGRSEW
jgi:hypothetical protein